MVEGNLLQKKVVGGEAFEKVEVLMIFYYMTCLAEEGGQEERLEVVERKIQKKAHEVAVEDQKEVHEEEEVQNKTL